VIIATFYKEVNQKLEHKLKITNITSPQWRLEKTDALQVSKASVSDKQLYHTTLLINKITSSLQHYGSRCQNRTELGKHGKKLR